MERPANATGKRFSVGGAAIGSVVIAVLTGFVLLRAFTTVDAGEACATTRFGAVTGAVGPGLHVKWPVAQQYHCFSTRAAVYETNDDPRASNADYPDTAVTAQTSDGQQIVVKYSIRFHVPENRAAEVYREVARGMRDVTERVVKFHSRSVVRLSMQEYSAQKIYSQSIFDVEQTIEQRLAPLFREKGVELESFSLRKIDFDKDYVDAVERKQIAQERIKTAEYDSDAAVNEARKQIELAKGEAQASVERARGEADAIRLRGEALRGNPDVLRLNFVEQLKNVQWGILPADAVTPFLPLPALSATPAPRP